MTTELQSVLAEAAQGLQVPGVAVGIWQEGREERVFWGVTSVENPLPVDEGTLFQIGSTTKTYTATALAVLAERGQLDFDAPVRAYLPELRLRDEATAKAITVRQLLNHTAGWEGDLFLDTGLGDDALARFVEAMAELDQTLPAGRAASYNNAAVVLAGRVVERVTGAAYEEALHKLVLEPLALEETHVRPLEVMTRRFAVGHAAAENGPRVMRQWNLARSATPAGGITSTVRDQLRYARFHLGHGGEGVLSPDARRALQRPTADFHRSDLGDAVGTSWLLKDWGGAQLVGHGGSTNGQRSAFQMVPARDFAVTVLTNASAGAQLHREVLAWILRDRLDLARPEPAPLGPSDVDIGSYAGMYANGSSRFAVSAHGDHLLVVPSRTPLGETRMLAFAGEVVDEPPFAIALLGEDGYRVLDGAGRGQRGAFLREAGSIWAIDVGGRLALRAQRAPR